MGDGGSWHLCMEEALEHLDAAGLKPNSAGEYYVDLRNNLSDEATAALGLLMGVGGYVLQFYGDGYTVGPGDETRH
jgi:hypothetical protein